MTYRMLSSFNTRIMINLRTQGHNFEDYCLPPWLIVGRVHHQKHNMDEPQPCVKLHTPGFALCQGGTHLKLMIHDVELDHGRVLISPDCRLMQGVDTTPALHPSLHKPPMSHGIRCPSGIISLISLALTLSLPL